MLISGLKLLQIFEVFYIYATIVNKTDDYYYNKGKNMISVNDFKTGLTLELDNGLWSVVEFLHVKPGKGAAFLISKLKNVETGLVV